MSAPRASASVRSISARAPSSSARRSSSGRRAIGAQMRTRVPNGIGKRGSSATAATIVDRDHHHLSWGTLWWVLLAIAIALWVIVQARVLLVAAGLLPGRHGAMGRLRATVSQLHASRSGLGEQVLEIFAREAAAEGRFTEDLARE
jgi:hypothetical protein